MTLVGTVFFGITSSCDQKTERLNNAAAQYRLELSQLKVGDISPSSVEVYPNGDCLTGSGVAANVIFKTAEPFNTLEPKVSVALPQTRGELPFLLSKETKSNGTLSNLKATYDGNSNINHIVAIYSLQTPVICGSKEPQDPICSANSKDALRVEMATRQISTVEIELNKALY